MNTTKEKAAFICSQDSLDGAYPPLILALNASRLDMEARVFFTFMGINIIRKGWLNKVRFHPTGTLGAIPGMSWIATWMMKKKIEKAQIPDLDDLQIMAQMEGVQFVACKMTVDMMEFKEDAFIDGVIIETAEDFMKYAKDCKVALFT